MDILTHTLSGVAVGTVASSFSKKGSLDRIKILLISGLGGALPDLDAISLWSKFDVTLGRIFRLENSGRTIYSAKFWYSHHAFNHSLVAALLWCGLIALCIYFINKQKTTFIDSLKSNHIAYVGFILGFSIHLLEDMPTPSSAWGGVNLLWPSTEYIGGWGKIWWWNNNDIWLIVVGIIFLNLSFYSLRYVVEVDLRKVTSIVFISGFLMAVYQINTRPIDFSYTNNSSKYQEFEQQSKKIQKDILGEKVYNWVSEMDRRLPFLF
ncbi:metal-dependent hydrolase [Flammeovirga pacifica]|uniref:Metal-dependent hydrolase n=1 Tax=Flammeovirga pacifica TaxID=915059 RepID=A0A1S1YSS3_FLAPC|nr:metal-dependent hydrolase [Flammeovirga pacifica]OHX63855.1 hypothetical protein NH26_19780 [Flammeovirga pacifica]